MDKIAKSPGGTVFASHFYWHPIFIALEAFFLPDMLRATITCATEHLGFSLVGDNDRDHGVDRRGAW